MLRYRDITPHTTEVLDLTSLTVDEFVALVPTFEAAFLDYMATWTLHGRRRQARRYTTYLTCPLPTPEDRLSSFWSTSNSIPRNCSMAVCSACASPKRHNGLMSYSPCCATPCAPWAMRRVAVSRPCALTLGRRRLCPWWRPCQPSSRPLRPPRPPFLS